MPHALVSWIEQGKGKEASLGNKTGPHRDGDQDSGNGTYGVMVMVLVPGPTR